MLYGIIRSNEWRNNEGMSSNAKEKKVVSPRHWPLSEVVKNDGQIEGNVLRIALPLSYSPDLILTHYLLFTDLKRIFQGKR